MLSLPTQAAARRWCSPHRHSLRPVARRASPGLRVARCYRRSGLKCLAVAQQGVPTEDEVERQLEESVKAIDDIVNEVTRELLLSAAVAHITGEAEEATQVQLVKAAVASRLDSLNNTFLPVLDSYVQGAAEAGNHDIAELLLAIHDEVVESVGRRLPPEMRVLNAALQAPSGAARLELIKRQVSKEGVATGPPDAAISAGTGSAAEQLPRCELDELERAVAQLIDEMEGLQEVPDRQLLARLCLLREEVHDLMREQVQFPRRRRQVAGAGAGGQRQQAQQPHPRYSDPTYQEAEVVVPAGSATASAGTQQQQQQQQGKKQKKGVPWGKPAQEVEVEVVATSSLGEEDGSSSGEEEGVEGAAATLPDGQVPAPSVGAALGQEGGDSEGELEEEGPRGPAPLPFEQAGAVPRSAVAFLKEVMAVNDSEKRRALLEKAFRTDWEGAAPLPRQQRRGPRRGGGSVQEEEDGDSEFLAAQRKLLERLASKGARGEAEERAAVLGGNPNLVRPGRFLQALSVVQAELLRQAEEGGGLEGEPPGQGQQEQQAVVSEWVLVRLEDVRREALVVLMDIAGESGSEYSP